MIDLTEHHNRLIREEADVKMKYKEPKIYSVDLLGLVDIFKIIKEKLNPTKSITPNIKISESEEKMLEVDEQIRNHNKNV